MNNEFFFGTSTAAAQIETAHAHQWKNVISTDGSIFNKTIEHEKNQDTDIELIAMTSEVYRLSLDWSKLQSLPLANFDEATVNHYTYFLEKLVNRNIKIMLVCHHFAEPLWFGEAGGWQSKKTLPFFLNYVTQLIHYFSKYTTYWNTINEPNVYALNSYLLGEFPPFQRSIFATWRVIHNLTKAHTLAYKLIKQKLPTQSVGLSYNTVVFEGQTLAGKFPAAIADLLFNRWIASKFCNVGDFCGISYYAKIRFDPYPITEIKNPGKLLSMRLPHDKMWEYYPCGLTTVILDFYNRYQKPIIITESGICTDNDPDRIRAIDDYLEAIKSAQTKGAEVKGYIHWSTFDNHEWNIGTSYRFGLVHIDFETMQRTPKPSAYYFQTLIHTKNKSVAL